MSETTAAHALPDDHEDGLKRSISGRLLFFYVLGDVLGSGIYVLIGLVAGAVGGAFFLAFAVGVSIATITGMAYAELATKYPRAAGAALYINKAFGNRTLTFLVTVLFLASSFAAAGSLASGFARYFGQVFSAPPAFLVAVLFIAALAVVNYIGITESVVANMLMTFVEVAGLVIVLLIGAIVIFSGDADFAVLGDFDASSNPVFAIVAGVSLAFFAMTGFENAANVAEETIDPARNFPRALIGGMAAAGVFYVLVSISAALTLPIPELVDAEAPLLSVVESGVLPIEVGVLSVVFAFIAMTAITNTTLVAIVTQPRVLYGMAREDVVPAAFGKVHPTRRSPVVGLVFSAAVVIALLLISNALLASGFDLDIVARLATVTVVLLLIIYSMVIVACFKLGDTDVNTDHYRAPRWLLVIGLVGNAAVLVYTVVDDPTSVIWCAGLVAVGVVLFLFEYFFGKRDRPEGKARGEHLLGEGEGADVHVVVATDGSRQSLAAAKHLMSFADPDKITAISVVGVISPYASVAFADEVSGGPLDRSFREAAADAVRTVAEVFDGWGPKVHQRLRSGSPASEIVKAATKYEAGLVVVASGGRGLTETVLLGSTAQRVQHSAPCPVLVVRPAPRKKRKR